MIYSQDHRRPRASREAGQAIWRDYLAVAGDRRRSVAPGDSFRIRCVYDNSAANQPVIDGVQITPTALSWGDGTLDEMCLSGVVFKLAKGERDAGPTHTEDTPEEPEEY